MKPDFALSLSPDGLSLLQRSPRGWLLVGEVPLDHPRLPQRLRRLRRIAIALAGRKFTTKLVLPGDLLRFATLPISDPAEIANHIDGLTPYPPEDLVWDWVRTDDGLRVALVARESLAEAEAFAAEHGLAPAGWVALPETDGPFENEPFFGLSDAGRSAGLTEDVLRGDEPAHIVGRATLPEEFARQEAQAAAKRAGKAPRAAARNQRHQPDTAAKAPQEVAPAGSGGPAEKAGTAARENPVTTEPEAGPPSAERPQSDPPASPDRAAARPLGPADAEPEAGTKPGTVTEAEARPARSSPAPGPAADAPDEHDGAAIAGLAAEAAPQPAPVPQPAPSAADAPSDASAELHPGSTISAPAARDDAAAPSTGSAAPRPGSSRAGILPEDERQRVAAAVRNASQKTTPTRTGPAETRQDSPAVAAPGTIPLSPSPSLARNLSATRHAENDGLRPEGVTTPRIAMPDAFADVPQFEPGETSPSAADESSGNGIEIEAIPDAAPKTGPRILRTDAARPPLVAQRPGPRRLDGTEGDPTTIPARGQGAALETGPQTGSRASRTARDAFAVQAARDAASLRGNAEQSGTDFGVYGRLGNSGRRASLGLLAVGAVVLVLILLVFWWLTGSRQDARLPTDPAISVVEGASETAPENTDAGSQAVASAPTAPPLDQNPNDADPNMTGAIADEAAPYASSQEPDVPDVADQTRTAAMVADLPTDQPESMTAGAPPRGPVPPAPQPLQAPALADAAPAAPAVPPSPAEVSAALAAGARQHAVNLIAAAGGATALAEVEPPVVAESVADTAATETPAETPPETTTGEAENAGATLSAAAVPPTAAEAPEEAATTQTQALSTPAEPVAEAVESTPAADLEFTLIDGPPPVIPPARPENLVPEDAALDPTADPTTQAGTATAAATDASPVPLPAIPGIEDAVASAVAEAVRDVAEVTAPDAPSAAVLAAFRPRPRPAIEGGAPSLVTLPAAADASAEEVTGLPGDEVVAGAFSLLPRARPAAFAALAAPDLATDPTQTETPAALDPGATELAIAASPVPLIRPERLAVSNAPLPQPPAAPTPQPQAQPEPAPQVAAAPVRTPVDSAAVEAALNAALAAPAPAAAAPLPEADDEPEITTAAPSLPTSASVAQQATVSRAINLRQDNLIGIYGTASNRRALVRTSRGQMMQLRVGDRYDGGQVAAINERELHYIKNGRTFALAMPQG